MFKRKAFEKLMYWKEKKAPKSSVLLEGARRVGKTTIAEEFAKQEYKSYIKVDFANIKKDVLDAFDDIS
ncbi:MAG: AAA family ATPase, partial [Firmicutes bacterium]|nr:AAA family ATPase [Bacillota bacterium]